LAPASGRVRAPGEKAARVVFVVEVGRLSAQDAAVAMDRCTDMGAP
jgi:hypothetical protein